MLAQGEASGLIFLHVRGMGPAIVPGADAGAGAIPGLRRSQYVQGQARYFRVGDVIQLERALAAPPGGLKTAPAVTVAGLLLTGFNHALAWGAARIVWPVQGDGQFETLARAGMQVALATQLAEMEHKPLPPVETPLLDFSDRQLVDLGARLQAPFELAWNCELNQAQPCGLCRGCQWRHRAFAAAGVPDPLERVGVVH